MATVAIDDYDVMYSANQVAPHILLMASGSDIGELIFMPDGTQLPSDTTTKLYYHLQNYSHILDLLRNEKPVYFVGNGPGKENGIRTTAEPVGEGEA